ncbi:MAG: DUF1223 domain-containing protein [Pseudomonadota bacterium]
MTFIRLIPVFALAVMLLAGPRAAVAQAEGKLVVVELFTSQGCMACPPADEFAAELDARGTVLPLSLHVDYWDYLGWRDVFASPAHTARQKAYAYAHGERSIYTPQMVVHGVDAAVGHDKARIEESIARAANSERVVRLTAVAEGDAIRVRIEPLQPGLRGVVHVVRFAPEREQVIRAGENQGRTLTYTNVVLDWMTIAQWMGEPAEFQMPLGPRAQDTAVILQSSDLGPVLAAARVSR